MQNFRAHLFLTSLSSVDNRHSPGFEVSLSIDLIEQPPRRDGDIPTRVCYTPIVFCHVPGSLQTLVRE
jgi:hypothetical protein